MRFILSIFLRLISNSFEKKLIFVIDFLFFRTRCFRSRCFICHTISLHMMKVENRQMHPRTTWMLYMLIQPSLIKASYRIWSTSS